MSPKTQNIGAKATGTIQSFFNGTVKAKKSLVTCPVCGANVVMADINSHMDSEQCKVDDTITLEVNEKRKSSENGCLVNAKKLKTNLSEQEDKDSIIIADLLDDDPWEDSEDDYEEENTPQKNSQVANSSQNVLSPSQMIILSPKISYNPSRYGGLHNISPSPEHTLVRTGSLSARDKYAKSPKRSPRKNLFTSELSTPPPFPQHDPFTPSKKQDAAYTPYYVTNFEYIIGCVLDCTEDSSRRNSCGYLHPT